MTFWPSPSRLALAASCGHPWSPHAPRWPKKEWSDTPARAFGEAFGLAIEAVAVLGAPAGEAARLAADTKSLAVAERRRLELCVEQAARRLDPHAEYRAVEVPLVYRVATGDAWQVGSREETFRPPARHLAGTIDLVEVASGHLYVRDWKTGAQQARDEDIRDNWQLRAYGLFAARAFGASTVTVQLIHVREDATWVDPMVLDELELGIVESEIRGLLGWLGEGQAPSPGLHCTRKYCPILTVCPVTQRQLAKIQRATDDATSLPLTPEIRDREHARQVRRGITMVEKSVGPIKAALAAWVEAHGGFEIEPGVWYGPVVHEGKKRVDIDAPGAIDVIREHLGAETESALTFETSATALKRAAREHARKLGDTERGAEGRVFKPLWDALTDLGAVKQGAPYTTIEEKKIRRGDAIDTTGEAVEEPEAAE